jgi:PAS domain S-box-containing protein
MNKPPDSKPHGHPRAAADQARLAAIVESSNDAIIGKTLEGVVTDWNKGAERMFGYTAQEAIGRTVADLIVPPEHRAEETEILARVARGESVTGFFATRRRRDGGLLDVSISVSPIKSADGRIVGAAKTVRDITERKRAEERFRLVMEASPNAILMVDRDRRIVLVNRKAEEMFGYAREELLGMEIERLIPERFRDRHPESVRAYVERPAPRAMGAGRDLYGLRKDGAEIPVEIGLTPLQTAEGLSVLATITDISERKRWENSIVELNASLERQVVERTAQLRAYSALQRAILANAGYAIVATDTAGLITLFNPAAEAMLGYATGEVVGKTTPALIHDPAEVAARAAALSEELGRTIPPGFEVFVAKARLGAPDPNEWTYIRKDGSRFPVLLNVSALRGDDGNIFGYLGLAADLTELKESAARLERANAELEDARARAERMAQAKSEFLANMSHEIRTPMNAIIGLAYLLENGLVRGEALDLVKKIRVAGRSLLTLINDILDFSKIEAGRLELEQVPFHLGEMLENLAAVMSAFQGDKDIEFIVSPPPSDIDTLIGDPLRLEQVLINLVSNAFKFTDVGEVEVAARCVSRNQRNARLRLSVRDTGIGIAKDQQAQIFSAFSQADSSTARRFGGSGLGLAIARQLVKLMGGELEVVSQPGEGAEFHFTLPFELGAGSDEALPTAVGLNVLIADDNRIAREALRLTARALRWEADVVDSGEAALATLELKQNCGERYDLLLIDWKMPGLDGLSTVEAMRRTLDAGAHFPVIIMVTAFARESVLQNPKARLLDGVVTKPVTPSALYDALILAQSRRRDGLAAHGETSSASKSMVWRMPGVRVLIVDDSEINREVAQRILSREGALVATAQDGQSAVEWVSRRADEVDIILMDVQMPLMDGHEAVRRIRRLPQGREIPIVALSAGAFQEQRDAALAVGMNAYVAKPFNVDQLIAVIQEQIGLRPASLTGAGERAAFSGESPIPDSVQALPGLEVASGLALWHDRRAYCRYLLNFGASYRRAGDEIAALLNERRHGEALAIAHKLGGAAGSLALTEVGRIAGLIDRSRREEDDLTGLAGQLQNALDIALASIEQYCASFAGDAAETDFDAEAAKAAPLLKALLSAMDLDNPDAVEPIMASLGKSLPRSLLQPIRERIEAFDFRAAELQTRALAEKLGIAL